MIAIVAVSENWGIGKDNGLLFSIPEDMKFFRETTTGGAVIMGRRTLESFPGGRPLKNRRNIVISGRDGYTVEGAEAVRSPLEAAELISGTPSEQVFVIGGGEVYRAMLPFCEKALVTRVYARPEADRFFPDLDSMSEWKLAEESPIHQHEGLRYSFCVYERV